MSEQDLSEIGEPCRVVDERIAELLEHLSERPMEAFSDSDLRLLEHISECDRCRDVRFEAEQSIALVSAAGSDFRLSPQFEKNLFQKLEAHQAREVGQEASGGAPLPTNDLPATPIAEGSVSNPDVLEVPQLASAGEASSAQVHELVKARKRAVPLKVQILATVAAAALLLVYFRSQPLSTPSGPAADGAWSGTISRVERSYGNRDGLQACLAKDCRSLNDSDEVRPGEEVRTDSKTRALLLLADGSSVALDRETSFKLRADQARGAQLERGAIVADVKKREGEVAVVHLPVGRAVVLGTKFSVQATADWAAVDVSRGEVQLEGEDSQSIAVRAGEEGRLTRGSAPVANSLTSLSESFTWSDRAFAEQEEHARQARGLGELRAQKPGEKDERAGAVTLTKHNVKIRLVDNLARTEVEEVFTNHTGDVLEGIFRFPMPADAKIERLALEVDGRLEEGAFVERERASAIWRGAIINSHQRIAAPLQTNDIVWVPGPWKDPALLEWQRGGRFELRIFPIPKHGSRRIVLAYTQTLPPTGSVRRYSYPLAHDPSGSTRVDEFRIDLQVRGHQGGVQIGGYDLNRTREEAGTAHLAFEERNFVPRGDLSVEYTLANENAELRSWVYTPDTTTGRASPGAPAATLSGVLDNQTNSSYVALALRPNLPRWDTATRRAYVIAVDVSRSMFGEQYRRAMAVVRRMLTEMDPGDVATVLACHAECEPVVDGFATPGLDLGDRAYRALEAHSPEGASDLVETVRSAAALARQASDRELRIVLVGDGAPTVGAIHPAFLQSAVRQHLHGKATINAVTVAADADLTALEAVTQTGGGSVLRYSPGQSVAEAAYDALALTYGRVLRNAQVLLPSGLTQVAPTQLGTLPAGGEALIVARMPAQRVEGKAILRGILGEQPFEQTYDLDLTASTLAGNAFVPRLFAAGQIAELERGANAANRQEVIALSQRYNVASRYTSLLVLESPAMFKAFGLDNERRVAEWTGEEPAEDFSSDGDVGFSTGEEEARDSLGSSFNKRQGGVYDEAPSSLGGGRRRAGAGSGFAEDKPSKARSSAPTAESSGDSPMRDRFAPPPRPTPAPTAPRNPCPSWDPLCLQREPTNPWRDEVESMPRRMIPMRRIWERTADIRVPPGATEAASDARLQTLELRVQENELNRTALKELYAALVLKGDLERATSLAERWSAKDPMDVDALTARADLAAQRGDRRLAIRILGSVVDVRPSEHKAQWRLARLHRWSGRPEQGCRHSVAVAQLRLTDAKLLSEALRCTRSTGQERLASELLAAADPTTRDAAERALRELPAVDDSLSGDFKLEADWNGAEDDLDLVLIHPHGYRVSWLGAPTRAVISASDVLSVFREGLALRGAEVGEYAVEVVRANSSASPVRGSLRLTVGSRTETLPFYLEGTRLRIATVNLRMQARLVPL